MRYRLPATLLIILALGAGVYFADSRWPALLAADLPQADAVLVLKGERKLYLLRDGEPYREYRIALGGDPIGHKQEEGDQARSKARGVSAGGMIMVHGQMSSNEWKKNANSGINEIRSTGKTAQRINVDIDELISTGSHTCVGC
ncbi:hypothetical protein [Nitrincola iocasae]|uniref:YkuD domain-containing protein n=1 Tax=Nitrincola iocasae TaxID=2614693 RepID=A0A5J6LIY1_9GAMM|nr:hypothetical protein [Nitrincola iocasae]QEW08353.1 hypothetical protein F5I99_18720 [Nitrincola iocasae]